MGLFSSSTKTDETTTTTNAKLGDYTSGYMGFSPWSFASLDPTAALAAMGTGTTIGDDKRTSKIEYGQPFKDQLKGMADDEKAGAQASRDALERITERQKSGKFLTSQETDFINTSLDKAFEYAHTTGMKDWTTAAQSLAGSRGLRTGDTPVAQPAMNALKDFELGLGSKRAELGLSTTLGFSQQQNQFDESLRQFQENLMQSRWQARQGFMFGGGMQGVNNVSSTVHKTGTETSNPSMMSNISQTMGVVSKGMDLVGKIGGAFSGGMSSMGSGASSMSPSQFTSGIGQVAAN